MLYCDARALAVERLAQLAPAGLQRVFLCNSGTEANETALKIARKHTGRKLVVSLTDGFHGRTLGALGATGLPKYRDPAYPIPVEHAYVPYGDLDVANPAGANTLTQRIDAAAEKVCHRPHIRDLKAMVAFEQCKADALSGAMEQLSLTQPYADIEFASRF